MDQLEHLFAQYGLMAVFLAVLSEQVGLPTPALPFLLLAGAHAVRDGGFAADAFALAVAGSLLGGMAWYQAGRRMGRRVLDLLCRVSMSPDTCVRKSELSFSRWGGGTLVLGKFIPGISVLAPPLAGALGMPLRTFLLWHVLGAAAWAAVDMALGAVFHRQVLVLIAWVGEMGSVALPVVGALLGLWLCFRLWRRWRARRALAHLPRIAPAELAGLLDGPRPPVVLDVRTAVGGSLPERAVPGARHLELAAIPTFAFDDWPADTLVVTYCACPQDASAARAAALFARRGIAARVLTGGIDGWAAAGFALEEGAPLPLPARAGGRPSEPERGLPEAGQAGQAGAGG